MKKVKILALAFLAVAAVAVTYAFKPAQVNFADMYFQYDGSSGNQFDPSHYTLTTSSATTGLTDNTGDLEIIRVTSPDEVYQSGDKLGLPKVDADDANSSIHSDLSNAQISADNFSKVTNRVWVQSN